MEPLTQDEKDQLLDMLSEGACTTKSNQRIDLRSEGLVSLEKLKEYRDKSPDDVRTELSEYVQKKVRVKKAAVQASIDALQLRVQELQQQMVLLEQ